MRSSAPASSSAKPAPPPRPRSGRAPTGVRCGVILLYHRIARSTTDPQLLCVRPEHLAEHLDVLRRWGAPTRVSDLATSARSSAQPRFAITFDDGYADNLTHALPLLERFATPATVFVAGPSAAADVFWWDELARLLIGSHALPDPLRFAFDGAACTEPLGPACAATAATPHASWTVLDPPPTARHTLYLRLCDRLRPAPPDARTACLASLRASIETAAGVRCGSTELDDTHGRPLDPTEIFSLAASGLVEIGGHTARHAQLSAMPPAIQRSEIETNRRWLGAILGRPTAAFAYPFGTRADFDETTVSLVRESGFEFACANFAAPLRATVDRWRLPRLLVRDWDGDLFARKLAEFWSRD